MKKLNKTLLILLCAGSISMAGCGNSAAVSKDSTAAKESAAAIETVDEEKTGTVAPEAAGTDESGDGETAKADASDASESSILMTDTLAISMSKILPPLVISASTKPAPPY